MSEEQPSSSLLKPILIMKDIELDGAGDGIGKESSKTKKHVTFNRMVEYYTYSETLTSWKRRLMSDNDLRQSMPTESKTCFTKH
uniref:Uncharacterized protein n=1 Tax=Drosophila melanogaster TaxID=7227 RepID=A1Z9D0_DROME|nr:uncharacterized protein Dmel_CG30065 [Drosophila melanogaster]AAM68577.1 uncharacterized protein Dmel_CG30065 [Drosophila melanogaster]|eukprot:NP_725294.1 uncharacterized protein Dmel_CG30065 [Drosophila melanogaster]